MGQGGWFRKAMQTVEQVIAQGHPNVWTPELIAQLTPEAAQALPAEQREAIIRSVGLEPARRAGAGSSAWADIAAQQIPVGNTAPQASGAAVVPIVSSAMPSPGFLLGAVALGALVLFVSRQSGRR